MSRKRQYASEREKKAAYRARLRRRMGIRAYRQMETEKKAAYRQRLAKRSKSGHGKSGQSQSGHIKEKEKAMIRIKDVVKKLATRELAVWFSTMQPLPGERELDPKRMKKYDRRLREGEFYSPDWHYAEDEDGNLWRCDGQHTSLLLARCPMEIFPAGLEITIHIWSITSIKEDGAKLFDMFNHPDATRTTKDRIGYDQAGYPDLLGLTNLHVKKVVNGYHYYLQTVVAQTGRKIRLYNDPRERGGYLSDDHLRSFAVWLARFEMCRDTESDAEKTSPNWWMVDKSQITSVMYLAYKARPQEADKFWGYAIRDDHPQRDDPSRQLSNNLKDLKKSKLKVDPKDYYTQALKKWELFLKRLGLPKVDVKKK